MLYCFAVSNLKFEFFGGNSSKLINSSSVLFALCSRCALLSPVPSRACVTVDIITECAQGVQSEHSKASSFPSTTFIRHPIESIFPIAMSKPRMRVLLDDSNVEPYQWGNSDRGNTDLNVDVSLIALNVLFNSLHDFR